MRALVLASSLGGLLLAACSPFNPDLGSEPFKCGTSSPECPEGYTCDRSDRPEGVCRADDGSGADAGPDAMSTADAGPFSCADDSGIEPNENTGQATVTPVSSSSTEYSLVGLSICQSGDVDVFRFTIDESGKNISVAVTLHFPRSQGDLVVEILNQQGVVIATGNYDATNRIVTANVPNAPAEAFYAQVRGVDASAQNNYNIDIVTTGP